jgi:hypothetical protein
MQHWRKHQSTLVSSGEEDAAETLPLAKAV